MATAPSSIPRADDLPGSPRPLHAVPSPSQGPPSMSPAKPLARDIVPSRPPLVSTMTIVLLALGILGTATGSAMLLLAMACLFVGIALGFFVRGILVLRGFWRQFEPVPFAEWARALLETMLGPVLALVGGGVALLATMSFARGRQVRHLGRVMLPPIGAGSDWTRVALAPEAPEALRRALAAQWRENGRTEHASVAAFARLTLDLMALGAPPRLIEAAQQDALDEIRHAELCFGLAHALDGQERGPAAFPAARCSRPASRIRTLALVKLAVDSLVDGALNEGVSARILAQLARRCEDPAMRAMLREIAADEGRHAAHGWDVVEWCVEQGGVPIVRALRGAVAMLPRQLSSSLPEAARDGSWERHGIHGEALEAEQFARAREQVRRRVEAAWGGLRAMQTSDGVAGAQRGDG